MFAWSGIPRRKKLFWVYSKLNDGSTTMSRLTRAVSNQYRLFLYQPQTETRPARISLALFLKELYQASPVKFMTWHRYYYSVAFPILYSTGCFPTHRGKACRRRWGRILRHKRLPKFLYSPKGKETREKIRSNYMTACRAILEHVPNATSFLFISTGGPEHQCGPDLH